MGFTTPDSKRSSFMTAPGVGESIKYAGETYRHVLKNNSTFVMTDPRQNHLVCIATVLSLAVKPALSAPLLLIIPRVLVL